MHVLHFFKTEGYIINFIKNVSPFKNKYKLVRVNTKVSSNFNSCVSSIANKILNDIKKENTCHTIKREFWSPQLKVNRYALIVNVELVLQPSYPSLVRTSTQ